MANYTLIFLVRSHKLENLSLRVLGLLLEDISRFRLFQTVKI